MEQGDSPWYIPGVGVGWQDIVLLIKMLKSGVEFLRLADKKENNLVLGVVNLKLLSTSGRS